jgi:hypothetical protein
MKAGWLAGTAISMLILNDNDYHLIRKVPSYKDLLKKTPLRELGETTCSALPWQ